MRARLESERVIGSPELSLGRRMTTQDKELYRRCDEVLHYLWDPIGVKGCPGARDEYDSYVPQVFSLVLKGADKGAQPRIDPTFAGTSDSSS